MNVKYPDALFIDKPKWSLRTSKSWNGNPKVRKGRLLFANFAVYLPTYLPTHPNRPTHPFAGISWPSYLWENDWQREFNITKCHSLRETRHYLHKQILHDYILAIHTAPGNLGKRIARKISWHNNHKTWIGVNIYLLAPIFGNHIVKLRINKWRKYRWTCRKRRNTRSVGEMLDGMWWQTLEAGSVLSTDYVYW